jgi:hypothetical protein
MAHKVTFAIPEKLLSGNPIKIVVNRDTTQRKSAPKEEQTKGKLGELHVSQAGIVWYKAAQRKAKASPRTGVSSQI